MIIWSRGERMRYLGHCAFVHSGRYGVDNAMKYDTGIAIISF